MQNTTKQNYPGSVASYNTRPGNEMGLFYKAPEPILKMLPLASLNNKNNANNL